MTDREKIKAEINRLREEAEMFPYPEDDYTRGSYDGYYMAFDKILLFICDLPEKPVSEGLDEACQLAWQDKEYCGDLKQLFLDAFKAGAMWQGVATKHQ